MANQETNNRKRATFSVRISVEAIVVILVVSATIGIFAVKAFSGGWEDAPVSGKAPGLRHDAISAGTAGLANYGQPNTETEVLQTTAAADKDTTTVVRNGVTVVSPPLLVPVINDDAIQMTNGSELLASPHKASSARKRSHCANRAHARGQRRIARSAPFWRIVAR